MPLTLTQVLQMHSALHTQQLYLSSERQLMHTQSQMMKIRGSLLGQLGFALFTTFVLFGFLTISFHSSINY
jgi:hypothetical protein